MSVRLLQEDDIPGLALSSLGSLATTVDDESRHLASRSSCRIIVIASSSCRFCRALAHGWSGDLGQVAESSGVRYESKWILAQAPKDTVILSLLRRQAISTVVIAAPEGGDLRLAQQVSRVSGTPVTLLVDRTDTIRTAVGGNVLPTRDALQRHCAAND